MEKQKEKTLQDKSETKQASAKCIVFGMGGVGKSCFMKQEIMDALSHFGENIAIEDNEGKCAEMVGKFWADGGAHPFELCPREDEKRIGK